MKIEHIGTVVGNNNHKLIIRVPCTERAEIVPFAEMQIDPDAEYSVEIKKKRKGRSLDANGYYWTLIDKLSKAVNQSKEQMHNIILARYGVDWLDEDGNRIYVLMRDDDRYLNMTDQHYRTTDKIEQRGKKIYRWYILLKPSHLFDTGEFSHLIDGLISECQEVGIETETPEWIERVKSLWKNT